VATLKARSPNLSLVRGTTRSPLDAERNGVWRSAPKTGCSMSLMYVGALPAIDWYTSLYSLYTAQKTSAAGVDGDGHHQTEKAPAVQPYLPNVGRPTADVIGVRYGGR